MNIEYIKTDSNVMGGDMEMKVYGHSGKPVIAFPCQGGRFFDWEDQGMIGTLGNYIDEGKIRIFAVDSIDKDPWTNNSIPLERRGERHLLYERYIIENVVPYIQRLSGAGNKILTTGCSMGGYHAANFALRYPKVFDSCISLSGVMRLDMFIGGYRDTIVETCTPVIFLENLNDKKHIELLRKQSLIICTGQGAWEEEMLADAKEINYLFFKHKIPALVDIWGKEVNHDWPWWKKQIPFFLDKILNK